MNDFRRERAGTGKISRRVFLKIGIAGIISVASYSYLEPLIALDISHISIPLGYGIRILQMTDSHLHYFGEFERKMMSKIAEESEHVDLIFLTGDIYDKYTPSLNMLEDFLNYLNKFKIVIFGNHEHYAENRYDLDGVRRIYERYDSAVLTNNSIEYKGVRIGGIDWYWDEISLGNRYLSMVGDVDILLSHTPDAYKLANNNANLTIAGHTHGGQICLPLLGPIWVPSRYGTRYAYGLFYEDGKYLYVSRGIGEFYYLPLRFNCKREIVKFYI